MRVYDTPNRYHIEPDIDPFLEDKLIEQYGEDWKDVINELNYEDETCMTS